MQNALNLNLQPVLNTITGCGEYMRLLEKDNTKQAQEIRQLKTELQQAYEKLHMEKIARECAEYNLEQAKAQAGNQLNLNAPTDQEMYPGEYMGYIICALKVMLKGTNKSANSTRIRSADVLKAILEANPQAGESYNELASKLKDLRQLANQQALATPKGKKVLKELNLETYKEENCHTGIRFKADNRYLAKEASTLSDNARGGKNETSYLLHALFPSENKV